MSLCNKTMQLRLYKLKCSWQRLEDAGLSIGGTGLLMARAESVSHIGIQNTDTLIGCKPTTHSGNVTLVMWALQQVC